MNMRCDCIGLRVEVRVPGRPEAALWGSGASPPGFPESRRFPMVCAYATRVSGRRRQDGRHELFGADGGLAGGCGAMTALDWTMIAAYFGVLAGLTWWTVLRSRQTAADYFLAGRDLSWWVIGASIFASNIGSEHIVGLAGSRAAGR